MADHKFTVRLDGEIQIYNATLTTAVRVGTECARKINFINFSSRVTVVEEVCTCTWEGDGDLHHRDTADDCPVHASEVYHMPLSYARHIEGN